jgi:hypothetical protein
MLRSFTHPWRAYRRTTSKVRPVAKYNEVSAHLRLSIHFLDMMINFFT